MTIRKAQPGDMPRIMEIFEDAKKYMREHGNRNQWNGAYPEESLIREEIGKEHCYVIEDSDRITDAGTKVIATFCFIPGIDPTYDIIYDGHWLNDEPYGTIHRLASDGSRHGIGKACIDFCGRLTRNLRADTHKDNLTMQNLLEGCGFMRCGIIHLQNGDERIAYHKLCQCDSGGNGMQA